MAGHYDIALVALSALIAVLAAGAALDVASRVTASGGRHQVLWLGGGAFAMGLGIWSMHYTGMLAFQLPVPVRYHLGTVALSLLAAIVASGVALYVASRERFAWTSIGVGSVLMGAGIAGMHYIGMAAMRLDAAITWRMPVVATSVLIAVAVSGVALWLAFRYGRPTAGAWTRWKIASALLMGAAIPAMHYTGMAAATFHPSNGPVDAFDTVSISTLGAYAIGAGTLLVLAMAIGTSLVSRYGEQRLAASERYYRALIDQALDLTTLVDAGGFIRYASPSIGAVLGYRPDELVGQRVFEFLHPEDLERALSVFADGSSAPGAIRRLEFRFRHRDGSWRLLSAVGRNLFDDPVIKAGIINARDITDQKRAEEHERTLLRELQQAVSEVKVLKGILPMCASCKRIHDGDGKWEAVDSYVREHTNADFSHGLCPDCAARDWGTAPSAPES